MPNKKINQLDSRTAVGTDLMLVGDPVNGTAFKSTLDALPLVPTSRVLTINGVPFDLSQNRSWTIDLSGYVPYIGATTNVNLGEHQLLAGQVTFDQSPTGAAGVGVMRWNNTDGTLDLGLKGGNVTLQVGQEQVVRVVNKSGLALNEAAYQVVKITDAQGQRLAVDLAQGNNDANSTDTIGIVTETIANNQEGFITTSGLVNEINTTGSLQGETWVDGDVIYLSPFTAGAITNIKPTAPNHMVTLGYVVYAHAIHGKIFVKCDNGFEIGELHNVYAPTPSNNDGIFWNTANQRYQNNSIAGVLGYIPISGSGVANQLTYWNGTGSVTGSSGLVYNDSIGLVGLTKSQNNPTAINITNLTSGTNSSSGIGFQSNGLAYIAKYSSTKIAYKIANPNDWLFSCEVPGDIAFLSDSAAGKIKWAGGGVPTPQMTLTAAGRLLLGTTTESTFILDINGTIRAQQLATFVADVLFTRTTSTDTNLLINAISGKNSFVRFTNATSISSGGFIATHNSFGYGTYLPNQLNITGGSGGVAFRTNNADNIRFYATNIDGDFSTIQFNLFASSGNIHLQNGGTYTDIASARLAINSTTQGFLPPRMTTTERNAIASPATGLVVYDTTLSTLNVYNGSTWGTLINGVDELQVALLSQVYG